MRTLILLTACALFAASARAQHPLPQDMQADFAGQGTFAKQFKLPVTLSTDLIIGRASFDNTSSTMTVAIHWTFCKTGAAQRTSTQTVDISFTPTAIAMRAGTTQTLYVIGWSERTGRIVIESWVMSQYALGSMLAEGGSSEISTFIQPTVTRTLEWVSDAGTVNPVWDAACNVYGDDLLLLESGTPTRIRSFDLSGRILTELYNSGNSGMSQLAGLRMLSIGKHGSDGLVMVAESRKPWEPMTAPLPYTRFVLKDANCDGVFESTSFLANDAFWTQYPVPWDMLYTQ